MQSAKDTPARVYSRGLGKSFISDNLMEINSFEEMQGLSTTDGVIMTESSKIAAIRQGAGLMIGDYFVGFNTSSDLLFSYPAIVY